MTSSTGQSQEGLISSNTSNALTFGAITTAPVTQLTTYAILGNSAPGTGSSGLTWAFGTSLSATQGKYLVMARGGATIDFNRLDMTTDLWQMMPTLPFGETLTTGSMYAYDGGDRLYFTKEVTNRLYYVDITKQTIESAGIYPYAAGTAVVGNRMEVFSTVDGLRYLWLNRGSNAECFRSLISYY